MKVRPLYDRVLVERAQPMTKTAGGIIIPDTAQEKPSEGIVVEVGQGSYDSNGKRISLELKKGDKVLFEKYARVSEIKIGGKEMLIIKESDILAVIE